MNGFYLKDKIRVMLYNLKKPEQANDDKDYVRLKE